VGLPDVTEGQYNGQQRPPYLTDAWEWSDESHAWELEIADMRIVNMLGYFCAFDIDDHYYTLDLHDNVREMIMDDRESQRTVDETFGLDNYGQVEGGYDYTDDLDGLRDDVTPDDWSCDCGHDEFYMVTGPGTISGNTVRRYGCTSPQCDRVYNDYEIPSGYAVNVADVTILE